MAAAEPRESYHGKNLSSGFRDLEWPVVVATPLQPPRYLWATCKQIIMQPCM